MMKTNKTLAVLSAIFLVGALAGCGSAAPSSSASVVPSASPSPSVVIKYNVNFYNGDAVWKTVEVEKGKEVAKPTEQPTKDGYVFKQWCSDKAGTTAFDFATKINAETNLYASWLAKLKVTFDADNGSTPAEVEVIEGNKVAKPAENPVKAHENPGKHYTFEYWAKNDVEYNFDSLVNENTTLKAKYKEEDNVYTVTFDYDDGKTPVFTEQVTHGGVINGPTTDPEGYDDGKGYFHAFEGWYDSDGNKCTKGTTTATKDITYKPKYNQPGEAIEYTISLVKDYADGDPNQTTEIKYTVAKPWQEVVDAVNAAIPKPAGGDTYSLRGEFPSSQVLENKTYYIDSEYYFTYNFSRPLDTYHHLTFNKGTATGAAEITKIGETNVLKFDTTVGAKAAMSTLNNKYGKDNSHLPTVEFTALTTNEKQEGMKNRTTFAFGSTEFDSSATWLRVDANGAAPANGTATNYANATAETGIAFKANDFNTYKYDFYNNDAPAGRLHFSLNGKRINASAAWTLTACPEGAICWGQREDNVNPICYYFSSISIKQHA